MITRSLSRSHRKPRNCRLQVMPLDTVCGPSLCGSFQELPPHPVDPVQGWCPAVKQRQGGPQGKPKRTDAHIPFPRPQTVSWLEDWLTLLPVGGDLATPLGTLKTILGLAVSAVAWFNLDVSKSLETSTARSILISGRQLYPYQILYFLNHALGPEASLRAELLIFRGVGESTSHSGGCPGADIEGLAWPGWLSVG